MAFKKQVASPVAEVQPFIQGVAKNLVERLYGPQGPAWGTRFSDIEERAVPIGQVLVQQLIHHALQRQACEPPPEAEQVCPTCGGPLVAAEPEPRLVTTRAGDAQWLEPATHCPRCRRDFFPSIQAVGD